MRNMFIDVVLRSLQIMRVKDARNANDADDKSYEKCNFKRSNAMVKPKRPSLKIERSKSRRQKKCFPRITVKKRSLRKSKKQQNNEDYDRARLIHRFV